MKNIMKRLPVMLIPALLLLVFGCALMGGGTKKTTRFFVLKPLPESETRPISSTGSEGLSIGIGPVILPDSLNRQQMVTRVSENEVRVEPFYRWAAPLAENITSVLAENLSSLLNTNRVIPFPWPLATQPEYQLRITVVEFMGALGGEARLAVRWVLTRGKTQTEMVNTYALFKAPVPSHEHSELVATQSRLLADFSREIARVLTRREKD
jgi:uncharacterized lipoprotein YmbA